MHDEEKFVIEELHKIYEIIRNQMVFAESKNTTVLVFNAAALAFFLRQEYINSIMGICAIIFAVVACILGILSFSPFKYNLRHFKKIDKENDSLIYFRNIASYKGEDYLAAIYSKLGIEYHKNFNRLAYDYAEEIIVIANITTIKNDIFMIAMVFTSISIFCMAVTIIL